MRLRYMLHTAALAVVTAVVAAPVVEIAVPSEPNASEIAAKDELKYHLEKATDGEVSVLDENAPRTGLRRFYIGRSAVRGGVDVAALKPEERIVKGVGEEGRCSLFHLAGRGKCLFCGRHCSSAGAEGWSDEN